MIHELDRTEYDKVRTLSRPLRYHLSSAAVLDGNNPGRVYVDDSAGPQSVFIISPEGTYLAGRPDNETFNQALTEAICSGEIPGRKWQAFYFCCHPEHWYEHIEAHLEPYPLQEMLRRHYVCRQVHFPWRTTIPAGFRVQRIDQPFLQRRGPKIPAHITNWMSYNWGSIDGFMKLGAGFATVRDEEVVSWSLMDCRSGDACEIGIRTIERYRRRGLATITAAATTEHLLSNGFSTVGWHCPDDNIGSLRTAERVGFEIERKYTMYVAYLSDQNE